MSLTTKSTYIYHGSDFLGKIDLGKIRSTNLRRLTEGTRNISVLVAIGVDNTGFRRVLGVIEGAKEDKAGWGNCLSHLKGRGLQGMQLFISDACGGLIESLGEHYPEARWQRCAIHFYRNVFSVVPTTKVREVAAMLKAIHAGEDQEAALIYYNFPETH